MARISKAIKGVALISPPWPIFSRPSIQLGVLKAYLKQRFPGLPVDAHHMYLWIAGAIGYRRYQEISGNEWLAETIYASLLYPERYNRIEKVFLKELGCESRLRTTNLKNLGAAVKRATDTYLHKINWEQFTLVGISMSLCQMTAGLYLASQIKHRFPNVTTVVGGSNITKLAAPKILDLFSEIDVVVVGEGELPLAGLAGHMSDHQSYKNLPGIEGVVTREGLTQGQSIGLHQINDLNTLPPPEFDEYFNLLDKLGPKKFFIPVLNLELSRGCWWHRRLPDGSAGGCTFCNLNHQWKGYRYKSVHTAVKEIDILTAKHQCVSVAFLDNVIPRNEGKGIFKGISKLEKDLRIFCEIRPGTNPNTLLEMKRAGVETVQIGVEALSTRLLRKINKGTTAIESLEIMKHCETIGLQYIANLMLYLPDSDDLDVSETLEALDFALPFQPLQSVSFSLKLGSPIWQNPAHYGIKAMFNHIRYAALFPLDIYKNLPLAVQLYHHDNIHRQRKLWQPVESKLKNWQNAYNELHRKPSSQPILGYLDGGDFLIIYRRKINAANSSQRLSGVPRAIYLFCGITRSLDTIVREFPELPEDKIIAFLHQMVDSKFMFMEGDLFLSLAVSLRNRAKINLQ